jgi:hypothetical protein
MAEVYAENETESTESVEVEESTEGTYDSEQESEEEESAEQIAELYIATFNRAPDEAGLNYWVERHKDGMSVEEIAKSFFDQPETKELYGESDLDSFIDSVYENVLDRTPDEEGAEYWKAELENGNISKDKFIIAILNGAKEHDEDRAHLEEKTDVGMKFVEEGLNDPELAKLVIKDYKHSGDKAAVEEAITEFAQNHSHQEKFGDMDFQEFEDSVEHIHSQHMGQVNRENNNDFFAENNGEQDHSYSHTHESEGEFSYGDGESTTQSDDSGSAEIELVGSSEQQNDEGAAIL